MTIEKIIKTISVPNNQIKIMKSGESVYNDWQKLKEKLTSSEIVDIAQQISRSTIEENKKGNYILPKTSQQILTAIKDGRMQVIVGRDNDNNVRFLVAAGYVSLGKDENSKNIVEIGTLIRNSEVSTKHTEGDDKDFISPIYNKGWLSEFKPSTRILAAVIYSIMQNFCEVTVIATSRSDKSMAALVEAGFKDQKWTKALKNNSCDSDCLGVTDYQNCPFADEEFDNSQNNTSGCKLMVLAN